MSSLHSPPDEPYGPPNPLVTMPLDERVRLAHEMIADTRRKGGCVECARLTALRHYGLAEDDL